MSFLFFAGTFVFFLSLAVIVVLFYHYLLLLFWCVLCVIGWNVCVCVVCRFYHSNIPFNKLYKCTNQSLFFTLSLKKNENRKTETACMTPSDNIVYALCNFYCVWHTHHTRYGLRVVLPCATKTNIIRRWLNYVCLCCAVALTVCVSVCVCAREFLLRHK